MSFQIFSQIKKKMDTLSKESSSGSTGEFIPDPHEP